MKTQALVFQTTVTLLRTWIRLQGISAFKLISYNYTDYFNEIIHTANPDANDNIYLHKNGNHYDVITSMPAFLGKDYYFHTCKKVINAMTNISVPTNVCRVSKQKNTTGIK